VNVRILAATNRQLKNEVAEGRFRADLFHRLSVYPIHIPPLRERGDDITLLAGYFCESVRRRLGFQQLALEPKAIQRLNQYHWPGNVRELDHVISRAALMAKGDSRSAIVKIQVMHLESLTRSAEYPAHNQSPSTAIPQQVVLNTEELSSHNLKQATEQFQRQLIVSTLEQHNGNWAAAGRSLEMDRANLSRMAKRLGIVINRRIDVDLNE